MVSQINPYGSPFATDPRFLPDQQQQQQQGQQQDFSGLINQLSQFQNAGGAAGGGAVAAPGGGLGGAGVGSLAAPSGGAGAASGGLGSSSFGGVGSLAAPSGGAGATSGGLGSSALSGLSLGGGGTAGGGSAAGGATSALASNPVGWIAAAALAQNVAHNKGIASWQSALKGQAGGNIGSHFLDQWGVGEDSKIRDVAGVLGWEKSGGGIFNPNYLSKKIFGSVD